MRIVVATGLLISMGITQAGQIKTKSDPTGKWKMESTIDGRTHAVDGILELKADGDKLGGEVVASSGQRIKIQDGKFKNGAFSFTLINERSGTKFRWSGKVAGDKIIGGKVEYQRYGQSGSLDWSATRIKD